MCVYIYVSFFIIHIHIRSIPKNVDSLTDYLHYINVVFSVIVITESWLDSNNKHSDYLQKYSAIHTT